MKPLLVVNLDRCVSGTTEHLKELGYDYVLAEGLDAPAVQLVPTKEDRRFTAAVAAMQSLLVTNSYWQFPAEHIVDQAVRNADLLLAELAKLAESAK